MVVVVSVHRTRPNGRADAKRKGLASVAAQTRPATQNQTRTKRPTQYNTGRQEKKGGNSMLKIFLNTWANYNENGADGGKWITLPMNEDDLQETFDALAEDLGDSDPEFFINDYEWNTTLELGEVSELDDIADLNSTLESFDSLDEWDQKKVAAIIEANGETLEAAIENVDDYTLYHGMDIDEVAEELVRDCYFTKDTPEIFRAYFDYEAFARDLAYDGYTETSYGVLQG